MKYLITLQWDIKSNDMAGKCMETMDKNAKISKYDASAYANLPTKC